MKRNEQRIFYLGRELKTGNRTLSALGIGNHNIFVLHLHSLAPKTIDLQECEDDKVSGGETTRKGDKSDDNAGNVISSTAESSSGAVGAGRSRRQQNKAKDKVVELLDSDSDSDDDDAVEIVEAAAPKRRKRG